MTSTSLRWATFICLQFCAVVLFSQQSQSPQTWMDKGLECRKLECPYEAIANFERAKAGFLAIGNQPGIAKACLEAGRSYIDVGNYVVAARHLEQGGGIAKIELGEKSIEYADALLELGWTYGQNWQYGQEQALMLKALDTYKRSKDKQRLARLHVQLGWSYLNEQFYQKSLSHLLEAKKLYDKKLVSDPYWEGRMHCFLYSVYNALGWMKLCKIHRERALAALGKIESKQGLRWGHIAHQLVNILESTEADTMSQKIDSIYTGLLGEWSIGKANIMMTRSGYVGDKPTMKAMQVRALRIIQDSLGPNSASVVYVINELGWTSYAMGQTDSALVFFKKAYSIFTNNIAGDQNRNAIQIKENIAQAVAKKGGNACADAMPLFEEALILREKKYGKESLPYINALELQRDCLEQQRADSMRLAHIKLEEKTIRKLSGDSSFLIANIKWWFGKYYANKNEQQKAVNYYQQCLELAQPVLDSDDQTFANIYSALRGQYVQTSPHPNPDSALFWGLKNSAFYENTNKMLSAKKREQLTSAYSFLMSDYAKISKYDSASYYLQKSVDMLDETNPNYSTNLMSNAMQALQSLGDRKSADLFFQKARAFYERKKLENNATPLEDLYANGYSVLFHLVSYNCDSVEYYFPPYIKAARRFFGQDTLGLQEQYFGLLFLKLRDCDAASPDSMAALLEQTLAVKTKIHGSNAVLCTDYCSLRDDYQNAGNITKANDYSEKCLECRKKESESNPNNIELRINYLIPKGRFLLKSEEHDSALMIFSSTLKEMKENNMLVEDIANIHGWLAIAYGAKEEYDSSNWHYKKAIELTADRKDLWMWAGYRKDLALNYMEKGGLVEAEKYMLEILAANDLRATKADSVSWLQTHGRIIRRMGRHQEARALYLKALEIMGGSQTGDFDREKVRHLNLKKLQDAYELVTYVNRILFEETKKSEYLKEALRYSNYALEVIDMDFERMSQREIADSLNHGGVPSFADGKLTQPAVNEQSNEGVFERLLENSESNYAIYEDAIMIHLLQYNLQKDRQLLREAYEIIEKGKMQNFRRLENALNEDVKMKKCEALEKQISNLKISLQDANEKQGVQSPSSKEIRKKIENLYAEAEIFGCYNREETEETTVSDVQRHLLSKGQTLLEYTFSDSIIFIAVIRKDTFEFFHEVTPPGFLDTIEAFRREVIKPKPNLNRLLPAAKQLYAELIAPVRFLLTTPELFIIPDGELFYLPFEALMPNMPLLYDGFNDLPFLVKDFSISYGLSAGLLLKAGKERTANDPYDLDFLAFAPTYEGLTNEPEVQNWMVEPRKSDKKRAGFGELRFNLPEVNFIKDNYFPQRSKTYLGLNANRHSFLGFPEFPRILHLALHAKSDDRAGYRSYLVFAFNHMDTSFSRLNIRVDVKEIIETRRKMPAEMIVLSGCETGLGSLHRGEGIVGFNRAFTFSGAKSIVSSLWSVDDEQTQSLLIRFYKHLKIKHLPKHKAMQAAKLELLEKGCSPFFWASFTVFGDIAPLFSK